MKAFKHVKARYKLEGQQAEIHMLGDSVCVRWNLSHETKTTVIEDVTYTGNVYKRRGDPFIDFVWMRQYDNGWYIDDDSPVDGGLNPEFATALSEELKLAVQYIEWLKENKEE